MFEFRHPSPEVQDVVVRISPRPDGRSLDGRVPSDRFGSPASHVPARFPWAGNRPVQSASFNVQTATRVGATYEASPGIHSGGTEPAEQARGEKDRQGAAGMTRDDIAKGATCASGAVREAVGLTDRFGNAAGLLRPLSCMLFLFAMDFGSLGRKRGLAVAGVSLRTCGPWIGIFHGGFSAQVRCQAPCSV